MYVYSNAIEFNVVATRFGADSRDVLIIRSQFAFLSVITPLGAQLRSIIIVPRTKGRGGRREIKFRWKAEPFEDFPATLKDNDPELCNSGSISVIRYLPVHAPLLPPRCETFPSFQASGGLIKRMKMLLQLLFVIIASKRSCS